MRFLAFLLLALCAVVVLGQDKIYNTVPVIGILAQYLSKPNDDDFPGRQYIAASYVKWIESAGARVIPVPINMKKAEAKKLFSQLNGILLPGGSMDIDDNAKDMINAMRELHDEGNYLPVWGTCQGMQWISQVYANNYNLLENFTSWNVSYHLSFVPGANNTDYYRSMPPNMVKIFADRSNPVTLNNHHWGVTTMDFNHQLSKEFHLISINSDDHGKLFVSTMEHVKHPVYAVQWHPEKNLFEVSTDADGTFHENINHTLEGVLSAQYSANFFVHRCRHSPNKFDNYFELQARLIYNYPKQRTGGGFIERYFFDTWF